MVLLRQTNEHACICVLVFTSYNTYTNNSHRTVLNMIFPYSVRFPIHSANSFNMSKYTENIRNHSSQTFSNCDLFTANLGPDIYSVFQRTPNG